MIAKKHPDCPASAYFVFLQLRSALKAYGVLWASSISSHPMRDWTAPSAGRPSVSLIYNKIIDCITKPLSIKTIWNRELSDLNLSVDWERVWSNLSLTSKNLAHRLIHFKVIHRAGLAKSLARRPGAIVFSSRATKMYHCPARRATLNTGLWLPRNVPSKLRARVRTLLQPRHAEEIMCRSHAKISWENHLIECQ